jgi:hypothetical protein
VCAKCEGGEHDGEESGRSCQYPLHVGRPRKIPIIPRLLLFNRQRHLSGPVRLNQMLDVSMQLRMRLFSAPGDNTMRSVMVRCCRIESRSDQIGQTSSGRVSNSGGRERTEKQEPARFPVDV